MRDAEAGEVLHVVQGSNLIGACQMKIGGIFRDGMLQSRGGIRVRLHCDGDTPALQPIRRTAPRSDLPARCRAAGPVSDRCPSPFHRPIATPRTDTYYGRLVPPQLSEHCPSCQCDRLQNFTLRHYSSTAAGIARVASV